MGEGFPIASGGSHRQSCPIMQIAYVDGPRLKRSLLAACEYAQRMRAELNRINVFPVPDGDTGTNLSLTVQAIADKLRRNRHRDVSVVAHEAAQAAIMGARGNAGMMLSHFLLGFSESVGGRDRMSTEDLGTALTAGVDHLHAALEHPVEGTILTVMRDTATAAASSVHEDFVPLIRQMLDEARESLARTPELLPVLRKAGVVDAGAKGFVHLLEGVLLYINGDPLVEAEQDFSSRPAVAAEIEFPGVEEQYRYCVEGLVRGDGLPDQKTVQGALRAVGDSLIVIVAADVLKVHVHTDEPERVFDWLRTHGSLVTHKAEDMRVQHETLERASRDHVSLARRPVTVVTDTAADLPDEVVRAHGIHLIPMTLVTEDAVYRDRIDISAEEFAARMVRDEELPTTSQPAPAAFLQGYARAAEDGEEILAVVVGSALSGTYNSAEAAAHQFHDAPVHLVDSRGASLLQGLLALKAAELAEAGVPPGEAARELARIRDQSGILFTVETFDRLLASGRVGRGKALLGGLLGVRPILGLTPEGRVRPFGKAIGGERVIQALLNTVDREITGAKQVRFGVIHVACPEVSDRVSALLRKRYDDPEILQHPATPGIATHVGPGAWGVAYLVED